MRWNIVFIQKTNLYEKGKKKIKQKHLTSYNH